ncbi:MAG: putative selenate ABC transporter substrate-binding protein [Cyanobacteriota bacterium]
MPDGHLGGISVQRRRLFSFLFAVGISSLLPAVSPLGPGATPASAAATPTLRLSAIPDQNPEKLNRLYPLVAKVLAKQLGVPVRYIPMVDYPAAVSAFRTGDLDVVWFGGLTGVQARLQKPGAKVLAQRDIDASFRSVFIANPSSGLKPFVPQKGLTALKGKRFTFGSENSTSGRLMPQWFLAQAGVKPTDFAGGAPGFSGSHDATIALVQSGAYQAGVVNEQVWRSSLRSGKVNRDKVFVLWKTPGYPDYHWLAQPDLDRRFGPGFTDRLRQAILGRRQNDPDQKTVMAHIGAQQITEARPLDYPRMEQVGRQVGLIR